MTVHYVEYKCFCETMSGYIVMSLRNDGEETTVKRWLKM